MNTPLLSLCMILKNEEKMLPACLESIFKYVDEIIIVDTGSTDRTIEIAKKYGAEVFHHPWENNFSKHRNQAIDHANGKWIIMMDADEELKKGSGEILRAAINEDDIDSIEVTNISVFNRKSSEAWVKQIRIFRNLPGIYYRDVVHEQLTGTKKSKSFPIYLYHHGYDLEKCLSEKKHERNVSLIKDQIKKNPKNYFYHLNLAVSYSTHFEYSKAVIEGITALRLMEELGIRNDNTLWAQYIVASAYLKLGDLQNAEKYALLTVNRSSDDIDSLFILVLTYHQKKDWTKLSEISSLLLNLFNILETSPEKFNSRFIHMANEEWRVHIALGDMHLNHHENEKAYYEFEKARSLSPVPAECDQIIGDCYRKSGLLKEAEEYYRSSLALQSNNRSALFGIALIEKAQKNKSKYEEIVMGLDEHEADSHDIYFEKGVICLKVRQPEKAITHFISAIKSKPGSYCAHQNLALAYKYSGRLDEAIKTNLKAIELSPESTDARINLGHIYYEMKDFNKSEEMFKSALLLDPDLIEVRLLLCDIYILTGDIEHCVHECEMLLKNLDHPINMTLNSLSDLADLFILIGRIFILNENSRLSEKALKLAFQLDPHVEERLDRRSERVVSMMDQH